MDITVMVEYMEGGKSGIPQVFPGHLTKKQMFKLAKHGYTDAKGCDGFYEKTEILKRSSGIFTAVFWNDRDKEEADGDLTLGFYHTHFDSDGK